MPSEKFIPNEKSLIPRKRRDEDELYINFNRYSALSKLLLQELISNNIAHGTTEELFEGDTRGRAINWHPKTNQAVPKPNLR